MVFATKYFLKFLFFECIDANSLLSLNVMKQFKFDSLFVVGEKLKRYVIARNKGKEWRRRVDTEVINS